jgi:hypothetical protein
MLTSQTVPESNMLMLQCPPMRTCKMIQVQFVDTRHDARVECCSSSSRLRQRVTAVIQNMTPALPLPVQHVHSEANSACG